MQPYHKVTLKNGIRLIVVPDQAKQVATVLAIFGVGSRYETDKIAGISHVLEHMFYKGTKKRPSSLQLAEFIEGIGGEHNAFTSKEYTGFYAKVASKHLSEGIDFISDLLTHPLFREEDLEKEKGVIIQEVDMYEDLPMEVVNNRFEEALFGKNSLGRDIIGFKESIKNISGTDLLSYHQGHYTGGNCVIVIAGNLGRLSEKDVAKMIEETFVFPEKAAPAMPAIRLNQSKSQIIVKRKTEQSHLVVGFRGASSKNEDKYALKMLAMILGGSMSSRMFEEIREKRGLAYAVHSGVSTYLDTGFVGTYAGVPHSRVAETLSAILEEYSKIRRKITDSEVAKAKEIIYGKKLISLEDASDLAMHYALSELLGERLIEPTELIKINQRLTTADLLAAAGVYFQDQTLALGYVGPSLTDKEAKELLALPGTV